MKNQNVKIVRHQTFRARYVLACHGGNFKTREMPGVKLVGETVETRWVIIDSKIRLWRPNRNVLTFWTDIKRPAVDIPLARGSHRWEFPLEADESDGDCTSHEQLWALPTPAGWISR